MSKGLETPPMRNSPYPSRAELTTHEDTQIKEKVREKNAERHGKLLTSDFGAFMHLVKSSLGSGFLSMPYAFHNIGLLGGLFGTAVAGTLAAHCTHILVKSSQELCYLRNIEAMSYQDTVEWSFRLGANRRLARYSGLMRILTNVFMFIAYYGVNTVYVIFIGSTFKQVLENHLDYSMNIRWYVVLTLLLLMPLGIVRHIKYLVPFSTLANAFLLIGCSITLYLCLVDIPPLDSRPMVVDISRWPLFFGIALFGLEGIGTVMPVENAMRYPSHFLGCPSVLNCAMSVVVFTYVVVGFVGYLKFGDEIQGSITLNLPQDALSEIIKVLVALAVLFTYPLQLTASIEVVWPGVRQWFSPEKQDFGYFLTRALLILGTVTIAFAVPNLSPVVSLVGAIGFSGVGVLMPTLSELVTFWDRLTTPCGPTVFKNVILILVWAFTIVSGSITSINQIIVEYSID